MGRQHCLEANSIVGFLQSDHTPRWLIGILLTLEVGITMAVIRLVPYTEIDFSTYLQHATAVFENGIRDYSQIVGESGPIAYPAGYLYAYELIRRITMLTRGRFIAQILFGAIYLLQMIIMFQIFRLARAPNIAYILATCSRRLHSIFVLRMFNDGIAMTLMHGAILFLLRKRWGWASILVSLALSVKMNILLFAPAFGIILMKEAGLITTIISIVFIGLVQILLAIPFITVAPWNYWGIAFNFRRHFNLQWSVNWQFLGERLFSQLQISKLLPLVHFAGLVLLLQTQWSNDGIITYFRRIKWRTGQTIRPSHMTKCLFQCNLLGIICARSLHYQFYSWYVLSLPLLLANLARRHLFVATSIFFLIELCWNIYPPSRLWSLVLLVGNILCLLTSC